MLCSPQTFEHCGFAACKITCDPAADVVIAYFTACKIDHYVNAYNANNLVLGALAD